jgi:hypothetical protein
MPGPTTILGQRGETAVQVNLLRPLQVANLPNQPFYPVFLGEKSPIFDLVVYLLDVNANFLGPHFYAQIKTTQTPAGPLVCKARMNKSHVLGAVSYKVPSYFIAVDAAAANSESCYIKGISNTFSKGIYGASVANDLSQPASRAALYNEVIAHFGAHPYAFASGI